MDKIIDSFRTDHPEPVSCKVKGSLPDWLKGTLFRNGPGKYRFGRDEGVHLFDGMAVLHQYIIKDGQVSYRNRFLDSDTYRRNKAANRIVMTEFGVVGHPDPCKSLFKRYFSYFLESGELTDNDCVNFMLLGDQLYVLTETPVMNQINPVTLDRIKKDDWRKYVAVHMATAHPMIQPDGTTYNMGTHVSTHSSYKIIKIPPPQPGDSNPVRNAVIVGSIPTQWPLMPNYFHSFGMTPNYIIFVEQPMAFNFLEIGTGRLTGTSVLDALHYYDGYKIYEYESKHAGPCCFNKYYDELMNEYKYKTKFHVLHKYTGSVVQIQFVAKPFFVFHHINAYEEDHQIVVDLCCYDDGTVVRCLTLENIRNHEPVPVPNFRRFVLPLHVSKYNVNLVTLPYTTAKATALDDGTVFCEPESIPDAYIELPRIHYDKYNGNKYRYAYGAQTNQNDLNQLIKLDVLNKTMTFWSEDGYYPGEPVFIANPNGTEEDDGVILSPVIRLKDDLQSFLLVLDAKSFTEVARALVAADINIPVSFHGIFADIQS